MTSLSRVQYWANRSHESKSASRIFAFLANNFRREQKLNYQHEKESIYRPKLKKGKYLWKDLRQDLQKEKPFNKFRASQNYLSMFIP